MIISVLKKKSNTCNGEHLELSNFQLIMNLKNSYFLELKCLHSSIFITIMSHYNIKFTKNLFLLLSTNWFLSFWIIFKSGFYQSTIHKHWKVKKIYFKTKQLSDTMILRQCIKNMIICLFVEIWLRINKRVFWANLYRLPSWGV